MRKKKHKIILRQLGLSVPMFLLCGTPGKATADDAPLFTPPTTDVSLPHKTIPSASYAQRQVPVENPHATITAYAPPASGQRHVPAENPSAPAVKAAPVPPRTIVVRQPANPPAPVQAVAANDTITAPTALHHQVPTQEIRTSFHGALPTAFTQNSLASEHMAQDYPKTRQGFAAAARPTNYSQYSAPLSSPNTATQVIRTAVSAPTTAAANTAITRTVLPQPYVQTAQDAALVLHRPAAAVQPPSYAAVPLSAAVAANTVPTRTAPPQTYVQTAQNTVPVLRRPVAAASAQPPVYTAVPAAIAANTLPARTATPQPYVQTAQDTAPVLHRPVAAASTQPSVVIIHHATQVADNTADAETAIATAPIPTPAAPRQPIIATAAVALRAPDPVDRRQLQFGRASAGYEPATDTAKAAPKPLQAVASAAGATPQECIILPWQLPKPPETVVAAKEAPQEVATKIITLDQQNVQVAMVAANGSSQPAQQGNSQNMPNAPLPFIPPGNPPPVLIPAQNPADVRTQPNTLSPQDKKIIDSLPPEVHKKSVTPDPIRMNHERQNTLESDDQVKKHNGIGIQISVREPKVNINKLLDNAYNELLAGDQENAIQSYRQVLDSQPSNKLALFGLATTYHRAGMLPEARALYGKLLAVDPYNFEGLNNYLVLLSDENPEEAIAELGKLEKTHPGFSPIPAQQAIIYEKTGDYVHAAEKMNTAINLSPENLKYRYNMAIILDKMGDWPAAAGFYQDLINASDRGEKIAANPEEIQQRLTFILSNKPHG